MGIFKIWKKEDYEKPPPKHDDNWMFERFDEGPPSGNKGSMDIWQALSLFLDLIDKIRKKYKS